MEPITDRATPHPLVAVAAAGRLPGWAAAGRERRAHMARVAALLEAWARELGLGKRDVVRWAAAGYLHDALRDASPSELGSLPGMDAAKPRSPTQVAGSGAGGASGKPVPPDLPLRRLPPNARHGPAAAILLRREGVDDPELLHAIRWHTLGSADFGLLGRALYAADFLEPGRRPRKEWREGLRSRAPDELENVLIEIVTSRIDYLSRAGRAVHSRTAGFRESLVNGRRRCGDVYYR
ncbi:MAG: hypothetical protein OXQ94_18215 [Gemmatimonadota bacterium]|nr:hypothetical protein [Gemmatimonadota bacterium]MDE2873611.1 hypothetical protein [Gemmatimonadota bacterium]